MKGPIFCLVVISTVFVHAFGTNLIEEFKTNPPIYCADPSNEEAFSKSRAIPPLDPSRVDVTDLTLSQVQVLIRHGARTTSRPRNCWEGYNPEWKCESSETITASPPTFLFPKKFDARPNARNLTKTNCEVGQLLPEGYKQNDLIGRILAKAYFKNDDATKNLFDLKTKLEANENLDGSIYFRSTEYQRTRMSGAKLLSSMVKEVNPAETDPMITLHTAGKEEESLHPYKEVCYGLEVAAKHAYSSKEYLDKIWNKNEKARKLAEELMGFKADPEAPDNKWPWHPQDCLGVSLCTGYSLPTGDKWIKENVELIFAATIEEFEWPFRANNSTYSKIASAAFTYEMKASLVKNLCKGAKLTKECVKKFTDDDKEAEDMITALKADVHIHGDPFILWSGHDTTIGPFLAAFGADFLKDISIPYIGKLTSYFPSYASVVAIELYEKKNTGDVFFRLIYNGRVITEHVPGCPETKDVCPIKTLFKAMSWASREFATGACQRTQAAESSGSVTRAPFLLAVLTGLALT